MRHGHGITETRRTDMAEIRTMRPSTRY